MLNRTQRDLVFEGVPYELCGMRIKKVKAESGQNKEKGYPVIFVYFLTEGKRTSFAFDMLRDRFTGAHWVSTYGHYAKATVSVVIDASNIHTLHDLVDDMYEQIWSTELGLNYFRDKVWFRGCENPVFLDPFIDQGTRRPVHRCIIDCFIEYEASWDRIDPAMLTFYHDIKAGKEYDIGEYVDTGVTNIHCNAPGAYVFDVSIMGTNIKYSSDVLLEVPLNMKTYAMATKIV